MYLIDDGKVTDPVARSGSGRGGSSRLARVAAFVREGQQQFLDTATPGSGANESVFVVFVAMIVLFAPVALVAPSFTFFVLISISVEWGARRKR